MINEFEIGQIIEGKVTGIQPYGAFVALNDQVQGLVHISEVTNGYVKDIHEHVSVGDLVKVKILDIDQDNQKISLSIRATQEPPKKQIKQKRQTTINQYTDSNQNGFNTLKVKLEEWIKQSKERETTFKK